MKSKQILSFFMTLALLVGLQLWTALPARADDITSETAVLYGGGTYTVSGTVTTGTLECAANTAEKSVTLHLNEGCTLNTQGIKVDQGVTLTIEGSGTLNVNQGADSETCQGINTNGTGGKIIITGGNINAKGRGVYPGIGGEDAVIEISGGTVNATGGSLSAGIGGGRLDDNNDFRYTSITITGGIVTATGGTIETGFGASAGIGGAANSGGGTISINGGTVSASGGTSALGGAAGIGSGYEGTAGDITIGGNAVVTAAGTTGTKTTGSSGAGIGSGYCGSVGNITITGGTLNNVRGGYGAAGIGDGYKATGRGKIAISGGTLTSVRGGYNAAGIGGAASKPGGEIEITGGTVNAAGGDSGAGIGGGCYGSGGNITISGSANVTAAGGKGAAGIGGGLAGIGENSAADGGKISITGGMVNATGGAGGGDGSYAGAGIGGGGSGTSGTITISGGTVNATGGNDDDGSETGTGIGSGGNKSGGSVTISGGTVSATAGGGYTFAGATVAAIGRSNVTLTHAENASMPVITANSGNNAFYGTVTLEKDFVYQDSGNLVTVPIARNKTIVPAETWTVTFDANGGTGTMAAQKIAKGSSLTLPENAFANTSYTFMGWNTKEDGSGTEYADKASVTPTGNMTLYAQWKHEHSFTYALSDDGKTIIATCGGEDCPLTNKQVTLTINTPTLTTYGGTGIASATLTGLDAFNTATGKSIGEADIRYVGRDGTSYTESATAPVNAGKYTAKITVEEKTAIVNYEIAKAEIHPTIRVQDKTYDDREITYTIENNPGDGSVTALRCEKQNSDSSWTSFEGVPKDAGTYRLTAVIAETENYVGANTETTEFTIGKRNITITAKDQTIEYGNPIGTGTDQVEISQDGLPEQQRVSGITLSQDDHTTVGTYEGGITVKDAVIMDAGDNVVTPNFTITYQPGKLTIIKAKAKVTTAPMVIENLKYNGGNQALITAGAADTAMEYVLGDNASTAPPTGWSAAVPSAKDPRDSYYVWYRAKEDENHVAGDAAVLIAAIGKAPLTITAKDQEYVYNGQIQGEGDTVYGNPAEIAEKVTVTGLQGSDAITAILLDGQGTDAGEYTLYLSGASINGKTENDNYTVTCVNGIIRIAKADQPAPAAPEADTISATGITLKAIPNGQYSLDGTTWQDSPVFTGLESNREYTFRQRLAEDKNHNASPASEPATIRTNSHIHNWSFTADGATITSTCGNTDGGHSGALTAALTVVKPEHTVFGDGKNAEAALTGGIDGVEQPAVVYRKGTEVLTAAPTEAGTFTAGITLGDAAASVEYTIAKAEPAVTAQKPVENLVYTGSALALVTPGSVEDDAGTLYYAVRTDKNTPQPGEYAEAIPTGTEAGTYFVWYMAKGDANHADSAPAGPVTVVIASRAAAEYTLTVRYVYKDGTQAAEPHTEKLTEGSPYSVASPAIAGFTPDVASVSGVVGAADVNVTVTYTANPVADRTGKIELHGLDAVPAELAGIYGSLQQLKQAMLLRMTINKMPVVADQTVFYDVELLVSLDGGVTWTRATEENFPAAGLTVILPYPEGTNAADFDFSVSHMFTVTSARLGTKAGEIETPAVNLRAEGIQVTLRGLSPVAVSWARKGTPAPTPTVTPAPTPTVTPAPTAAPAEVPKTGDPAPLALWLGMILCGALAAALLTRRVRKNR